MGEHNIGQSMSQIPQMGMQQKQSLIMSAQMRQGIEMLMMNTMQLDQFVEQQLIENPMLELDEFDGEDVVVADASSSDDDHSEQPSEHESVAAFDDYDCEVLDNVFETPEIAPAVSEGVSVMSQNLDDEFDTFEILDVGSTSDEMLFEQLRLLDLSSEVNRVATAVIGCLDERGYFAENLQEFASREGVGIDVAERAVKAVRSLDPPGIASATLRECLLAQVTRMGVPYPIAVSILEDESLFEKFIRNKRQDLMKELNCSPGALDYSCDLIASLNPYPISGCVCETVQSIAPDVVCRKVGKDWEVHLTSGRYRSLKINEDYRKMLAEKTVQGEDAKYFKEKMARAVDLLINLGRRNETLLHVARSIVARQTDFMNLGAVALKPMKMSDIAMELGRHEATIARTVSGKYMDTPQGLIEMKAFFSRGIGYETDGSGGVSGVAVLTVLKELVESEDTSKPYQDAELVRILGEKGYRVARRTVAKYRDKLQIPPAKMRIKST